MKSLNAVANCLSWAVVMLSIAVVTGCGSNDNGRQPILGGPGGGGGNANVNASVIIPGALCTLAAGPAIPTATSSDPTSGNQFVTTSTSGVAGGGKTISASFSLPMDGATVDATSFTLTPAGGPVLVPASVVYDAATGVAKLTTASALVDNTTYTATITVAVTSLGPPATPIACSYAWNFKTATPPASGVGQTNLGILAPFGIGSAGGLTNSGATKINGNVVLAPNDTCNATAVGSADDFGACGGNPLNVPTNNAGDTVITQTHPDTTTADAVMAVLLAKWNEISPAGTPGATVLGCGTIGTAGGGGAGIGCAGNPTLPPGAYISASGSTIDITGDLTLDAGGNTDAVWVFQAPSDALTTSVNSRILLTGGAKASNVWWYVGSSATLGGGTDFQGNILASASISLGTLATSCGRLLAGAEGAGAFTFLNNTVSVPGHPNAPVGCQ